MDKVDFEVGAKIRSRRQELGLSLETVASALGLTFQQLQKYEKGSNRVSASRLYGLSRILDVAPGYFFDSDIWTPSLEPVEVSFWKDPDCLRLNQAYRRITDPNLRKAILALIQQIGFEPCDYADASIAPASLTPSGRLPTQRVLQDADP